MPLPQILQTLYPQEIAHLEPWHFNHLRPVILQLLLLQPVPIIHFISYLDLHILRPSVTRLQMDVAQEAPAFLELEVEDRVGGFEEWLVVGQDVFDDVFGFHHAFPSVVHVFFHHV